MPTGAESAVKIATSVGEIGFPEFTAKLITDTFDALISANVRQTESYIDLVSNVSKDLITFINDTKDDISGDMVLDFLKTLLPDGESTKIRSTNTANLSSDDATTLNNALLIKDANGTEVQKTTFDSSDKVSDIYQVVLEAVAKRLAANKYTVLQEMVKMGLLRLVIENGLIETRLTFNTYGYTYNSSVSSQYNRSTSRSYSASGLISTLITGPSLSANTRVSVSTATQKHYDSTGSSVQIFGMVRLNFKTDYMPLNQ